MAKAAPPPPAELRLELHPRQSFAFESEATEILYGGAAGGGKSHLMRVAAVAWCVGVAGLQVYLFRRTSPDLVKNHMQGPSGFPSLLASWIAAGWCRINWGRNAIEFKNGSRIQLAHCQHEKDVYSYQGAEIHVLMMDELTHFTKTQYTFLRSRVRMAGLKIPESLAGRFPRILNGSNPGGVGHNWVKMMFVDYAPPGEVRRTEPAEGGMLRQFIPALLEDNPTLSADDPNYEARLQGLGDPALVRAMRTGDWDIVAGGMFDDLWDRNTHILEPFDIPAAWRIDRSFDWGSSKPFSVGWWAESDGTPVRTPKGERVFPRGSLIRIGEWYGWDGKNPNVGLSLSDTEIGRGIREREYGEPWGKRVLPGPADSMIFAVPPGGKSIAQELAKHGIRFTEANKSPGSRKNGWEVMRRMLKATREQDRETPHLYVFDHCTQFIRTIPTLPRLERDRDDVDTHAEDHIADETRYRVSAPSRKAKLRHFKVT